MGVGYNPRIVTNGMILCLDAGNRKSYPSSGTTWTDLSGNGYHGTLTNGPTYSSSNLGNIVHDGVDDYIGLPYSSLLNLGDAFTICAFVKINDLTPDIVPIVCSQDVVAGTQTMGYGFFLGKNTEYGMSGGTLRMQLGRNTWGWKVFASNGLTITDNNWHFISVVVSGATATDQNVRFHLDSNNVAAILWTVGGTGAVNYASNISSIRISSIYFPGSPSYYGPGYITGSVGAVSMYNRALSAQEVSQNFNALRGRYGI